MFYRGLEARDKFLAVVQVFHPLVVVEELVPESHRGGHNHAATLGAVLGFAVMMTLDVALG